VQIWKQDTVMDIHHHQPFQELFAALAGEDELDDGWFLCIPQHSFERFLEWHIEIQVREKRTLLIY
jgi:hypothetical protein